MLNDETLAQMIGAASPLLTDVDSTNYTGKESAIQPGSVDLAVGDIFRPSRRRWFSRRSQPALSEVVLKQGETAVIRSKEQLAVPDSIAAIAFPPARVSTKGLLMTNAGHIDPGYKGYLHLTVINMGREDYVIRKDDRLVSLLFFKLNKKSAADWTARRGGAANSDFAFIDTALKRLSPDFLDVQERAKAEASKAVTRMTLWQFVIPVIASIITSLVAIYLYSSQNTAAIAKLEGRIGGIGANVNLDVIESRLNSIEEKIPK